MEVRFAVTLALSLTLAAAPALEARPVEPAAPEQGLAEGTRVRLRMRRGEGPALPAKVEGRIVSLGERSLTLRLEGSRLVTLPTRAVHRVQVSAGRHSRSRGALIGAGLGAALVASYGTLAVLSSHDAFPVTGWGPGHTLFWGTPMAALGGAALGVLVPPGERWETVPRERLRVTARPILGKTEVGVRVAVSF